MKKVLFVVLIVASCLQLGAQSHRDSVINQAQKKQRKFRKPQAGEVWRGLPLQSEIMPFGHKKWRPFGLRFLCPGQESNLHTIAGTSP